MSYIIVSCIKGQNQEPRSVGGLSKWDTGREAQKALNFIWEEPDHPDPDDYRVMRDPERISGILASVEELWRKHPDMRLGQLVSNLMSGDQSIFYVEDDVLYRKLRNTVISGFAAGILTV